MTKEQIERCDINMFLKLLSPDEYEFLVQPAPEPDFLVVINGKRIGIEHTRLTRRPDANGVDIKAHTVNARRIMNQALEKFLGKNTVCLMIHVSFRCSYGLSCPPTQLHNIDIEPLSDFISDFVTQNIPIVESSRKGTTYNFESFDWVTGEDIFPDKIDSISITNTSHLKNHCWTADQGGVVPGIFESLEFAELLSKKNSKPPNYRGNYDEIWLLMVEDGTDLTTYFHFDDQDVKDVYTTFDRVHILRRADSKIIELSTCKA